MKPLSEQILDVIEYGKRTYGSAAKLARASGISEANLSRWAKKVQIPRVADVEPLLSLLGAQLVIPDHMEPSTPVQYVTPHLVPSADGHEPPASEDYIAVPVIDELQAAPGPVSPIDVRHYLLILRSYQTIRYKRDLVAVIKDKTTNVQEPAIRGGDICVVDRDDIQPGAGDYMLVRTPATRQGLLGQRGMICRVQDDGDELTYYSDYKGTRPLVYSISKDYGGDARKAIIGKVLFCWCDMQGR